MSRHRRHILLAALSLATALAACAGRSPQQISVVQSYDAQTGCAAIQAELNANSARLADLNSEQGAKLAQNLLVGAAGLFIPVLWLGMDLQGSATADINALQARDTYLAGLAAQRCS